MPQLEQLAASLAAELGLDAREIDERKRFLELGAADVALLKSLHDRLEAGKDRFTSAFYQHLLQFEPLRALIGDASGLARLSQAQSAYFSSLTEGVYDEAYVRRRLGVGAVHQRIGLEPKWYLGACRKYLAELLPLLARACEGDNDRFAAATDALLKVVMLDMGLAFDTFLHHERQESARSQRRAGQMLRSIVEGTASVSGPAYLQALAKHVADALGVRYAVLGICEGTDRMRTLAVWAGNGLAPNFTYDLVGSPCQNVVSGDLCAYPNGVTTRFPDFPLLAQLGVDGYIGSPVIGNDGKPLGILTVMDDRPLELTDEIQSILRIFSASAGAELERMGAEADIRRLNETLEQRVRDRTAELEAFSYSLSHDLRAPLRSILGFSQAVLEDHADALPEEGRGHLNRVIAAGKRMDQLIEGMLGLFHVGAQTPAWVHLDLGELVQEVCEHFATLHPGRKVRCEVARPVLAAGDPRLLRAMLENLVGNAWKYTARRDEARIEFGVERRDGGQAVYFLRDNGTGFDMQHAARLFEPFQRMHKASDFPGTGIGLATVRRILSLHGGSISAHAEPDRGCTFFFNLGAAPG